MTTAFPTLRKNVSTLRAWVRRWILPDVAPVGAREWLRTALGAGLAVTVTAWLSRWWVGAAVPPLVTSMGASAVMLFAVPGSPLAQPWPLVVGHLIAVTAGVTCALWVPDPMLAAPLAVALAVMGMHAARALHPPGGAAALLMVLGSDTVHQLGYGFLIAPLLINLILMLAMALLVNRWLGHHYPAARARPDHPQHKMQNPAPLARMGITTDDLRRALGEMQVFVDVTPTDLDRIYHLAGMQAFSRTSGEVRCRDIMSRDLVTVQWGTELEQAWALLRYHKIGAIPVVDGFQRVQGMLSLVDFLKRAGLTEYQDWQDRLVQFIRRTPGLTAAKPEVVGQIMASPATTVRDDMLIVELVPLLSDLGLHHVPVVDAELRLVGMITQSDLIAALYRGAGRHE